MKIAELAQDLSVLEQKVDDGFAFMHEKFDEHDRRFDVLEDLVRGIYTLIDDTMGELKTMRQEQVIQHHRMDRHERWIGELAEKAEHRLTD